MGESNKHTHFFEFKGCKKVSVHHHPILRDKAWAEGLVDLLAYNISIVEILVFHLNFNPVSYVIYFQEILSICHGHVSVSRIIFIHTGFKNSRNKTGSYFWNDTHRSEWA